MTSPGARLPRHYIRPPYRPEHRDGGGGLAQIRPPGSTAARRRYALRVVLEYNEVASPMTRSLAEAPMSELRTYGAWFLESKALRIAELEALVRSTPAFDGWRPDFTRASLATLDVWLPGVVALRRLTEEERRAEIAGMRAALKVPAHVRDEDLGVETDAPTARSLSIAFDVGVYFGETLVRNMPGARWQQALKGSRRYADFGHVEVVGVGVPLNPVRVCTVVVIQVAQGQASRLAGLYDATFMSLRTPPR